MHAGLVTMRSPSGDCAMICQCVFHADHSLDPHALNFNIGVTSNSVSIAPHQGLETLIRNLYYR